MVRLPEGAMFFPCFFLGGGGSYEQVPAMKISGATILGLAKSIYYICLVKLVVSGGRVVSGVRDHKHNNMNNYRRSDLPDRESD